MFIASLGIGQQALQIEQINARVGEHLHSTNTVFNWNNATDLMVFSGLVQGDSIAAIGYKPGHLNDIRAQMHEIDVRTPEWIAAKELVQNAIIQQTNEKLGTNYTKEDLLAFPDNAELPYFYMKVFEFDVVKGVRQMDQIRYFEPAGYTGLEGETRSAEGCADYSDVIDAADYTSITPASIQSWHHFEHDVDDAWTKCDQGEGIWVSLMDTGVSDTNPKFNAEFDEGDSGGRSIETNGYYQNDGWNDECGHGSAMGGLIAAPRGYDDTPAGIAYKANLISNRVTNDVVINATDEINGLGDALVDAANDSRVDIISISLGDVFSHGPVEDGIIDAYNMDKLIFAAAGTSTTFLNWYGVIFPANMPEAVAVTGAIEGTNFDECDVCHTGNEVQFTVYMERSGSGNKALTITNDDVNSYYRGYVGGSSAATASMAGIAAMAWGNNPSLDKDQILNRLIQTASLYPNKDDDFGWGAVNACDAVDSTFALPCSASLSNDLTMEITSITFPPVDDGFGSEAEWVVIIEGQSYYFNVPEGGASGNPVIYNDPTICDSAPISIDLGTTNCGDASVDIDVETHEDDGTGSDCDYSSTWDDEQTISIETVDLGLNSFTQTTSNGDFVFEYVLYCSPTFIAGISDDTPKCPGDLVTFVATPAAESNYEFFEDVNSNGLVDAGETLQSGPSDTFSSNTIANGDIIGVVVSSTTGCLDTTMNVINMVTPNYAGVDMLTGTELGIADYETNTKIESDQVIGSSAIVDYDSETVIDLQAGFEVQQGAQFEAFIDGCNDGAGGQNAKEEEVELNK